MQAKKRLSEISVIQSLIDEPQRFQFVQAARVLLRWMVRNGVPYERALAHVLRFQNSLSLNFPAGEIEALLIDSAACGSDTGLLQALRDQAGTQISLVPTFLGLLGANGALPLHATERIAAVWRRDGDASARAFIDLFSHRMVSMFFQAWSKYRLEQTVDIQGKDGQLPLLMALAGQRGGDEIDHVAGYYAGLLRTRPVAANSVSRILSNHFGVPIVLEPFVEAWDDIPDNQRSRLGRKIARLGYGATLGGRLRRRDIHARLNLGPLDKAGLERFLPRSKGAVALAKIMSLFGLSGLKIEVRLILQASCVEPLVLASQAGQAKRLGWDAFLTGRDGKVSRNTLGYLLPPPLNEELA
jgi:type VI secretion system protein ImpH